MHLTGPRLSAVVTYLEMTAPPVIPAPPRPAVPIALLRTPNIPVSFYRYLYETVGEAWLWYERRRLDDETLCSLIHDEGVEIYVLYVNGAPGGYGELKKILNSQVDLAYFGLLPEFIGRGLGKFFLHWMIDQAWRSDPTRVTVNTCDLDHPRALKAYQGIGFVPYRRETQEFVDPRTEGMFAGWQDCRPIQATENH